MLDRDRPVAQPCLSARSAGKAGSDDDRLARLERRGLIRRGTGERPEWLGKRKPVHVPGRALEDLLAERATGW